MDILNGSVWSKIIGKNQSSLWMFMHLIFNQKKWKFGFFSTCCYFSFFNPSNLLSGKRSQTRKESPQSSCKCVNVMYRFSFPKGLGWSSVVEGLLTTWRPWVKKIKSFHENLSDKVAYELISNFLLNSSHLRYSFSCLAVTSEDDPSFPIKHRVFPLFLEGAVVWFRCWPPFLFTMSPLLGRSLWGIPEPVFWWPILTEDQIFKDFSLSSCHRPLT